MTHTTFTNFTNLKKHEKANKLQNTSSQDSKPVTDYGLAKRKRRSRELSGSQIRSQ